MLTGFRKRKSKAPFDPPSNSNQVAITIVQNHCGSMTILLMDLSRDRDRDIYLTDSDTSGSRGVAKHPTSNTSKDWSGLGFVTISKRLFIQCEWSGQMYLKSLESGDDRYLTRLTDCKYLWSLPKPTCLQFADHVSMDLDRDVCKYVSTHRNQTCRFHEAGVISPPPVKKEIVEFVMRSIIRRMTLSS